MQTTDTRQRLLQRADVPDEDIDDIIARAAQLQDAERAHEDSHATVAEVEAVAAELDIDPAYVDKAIAAIKGERQAQELHDESAQRNRARWLRTGVLGAVLISLMGGLTLGGTALIGRASLAPAREQVALSESALDRALDRQVALAPQLAALAGAETQDVKAAADAAMKASQVQDRIQAATELNQAMAEAIGSITAQGDDQAQQRLLNLQYEVVGSWNRIDAERGRYDEAIRHWEGLADSPSGRVALTVGLVSPPDASGG